MKKNKLTREKSLYPAKPGTPKQVKDIKIDISDPNYWKFTKEEGRGKGLTLPPLSHLKG